MNITHPTPHRVIVIGGGITGLSAAHRLVEAQKDSHPQIEVSLVEAGDRVGGTINTSEQDGFLIEYGPDSFLSTKPWALALCRRLGIEKNVIPTNGTFRRSYILSQGRLHPIPEGFLMLAPTKFLPFVTSRLFTWPGKLRMGIDLFLPRGPVLDDESLASFVTRRLGREALERIAQPLVGGIYTADPQTLSLRATMPRFLEMETKHRSIIKAMWSERRAMAKRSRGKVSGKADGGARYSQMVSFDRGMQTIVDAIMDRMPEGLVETGQTVLKVRRQENAWQVEMADHSIHTADSVMVAVPAYRAAELLSELDTELATHLSDIPYASSLVVNLAYRREDVPHPLDGFGFVVPAIEKRSLIACSFSSIKFADRAPEGHALLRAFVGGATQKHLVDLDDNELLKIVQTDLEDILAIRAKPLFTSISRHPASMPQYPVNHLADVARIQEYVAKHTGLAVIGNAYSGIGMPDCVHSGEAAVEQILDRLK
ncbi:MAG: protoporphyrinogen oxidase [Candidatus Latescibacteria bacterium]|nr:protoporphyrinogen oxidase [Candidatus Latescibacterota bacterium]